MHCIHVFFFFFLNCTVLRYGVNKDVCIGWCPSIAIVDIMQPSVTEIILTEQLSSAPVGSRRSDHDLRLPLSQCVLGFFFNPLINGLFSY